MRRKPLKDSKSRRVFSKTSYPHRKNYNPRPMRGGIRL